MGRQIEDVERKEAKERQGTRTDLAEPSGKFPEGDTGDSRDKVGQALAMSGKTYETWRLAMLALLLTAALWDLPQPRHDVAEARDLATLSRRDADRLAGRPARYVVRCTSNPSGLDGGQWVECDGPDDEARTVVLVGGEPAELLVVEGTLRVLEHRPRDGFPGFTEFRVEGARVVRGW